MGLFDVVKFEGLKEDWLLYKFPGDEFNTKSKLIVSTGQIAIIVHNGQIEKICESGTFTLDSELLPFIKGLTKAIYSGKNPYPLEIYFLNKRLKLYFLWGTKDPIDIIDPVYGIRIRLRARGQLGVKLTNYQYFLQTLIGSLIQDHVVTFEAVRSFFRGLINQKAKKLLAVEIIEKEISYFDINVQLDGIQESLQHELDKEFEKYGFKLENLSIETIDCPNEDLEALNAILHKKAELHQLGDTAYRTVRGYDVLEAAAEGGGVAPTIVGVGLGGEMGKGTVSGGIIPQQDASVATETEACPKCGASISPTAKFCPECGLKILRECPKCGAKVTTKQKFCPECGTKLYDEGDKEDK